MTEGMTILFGDDGDILIKHLLPTSFFNEWCDKHQKVVVINLVDRQVRQAFLDAPADEAVQVKEPEKSFEEQWDDAMWGTVSPSPNNYGNAVQSSWRDRGPLL